MDRWPNDRRWVRSGATRSLPIHCAIIRRSRTTPDFNKVGLSGHFVPVSSDTTGGHCVTVSGMVPVSALADTGINFAGSSGTFLILKNSWGCDYGDGGYVMVDAAWLSDHLISLSAMVPVHSGANNLPQLAIATPNDFTFPFYGNVTFTAGATDYEDGDISNRIVWTSNVEGALGTGAKITVPFTTNGWRTITATVTDSDGAQVKTSVTLSIQKPTLTAEISRPTAAEAKQLVVGQTYQLRGSASEDWFPLDCSAQHWKSSLAADNLNVTGCLTQLKFSTAGNRTLSLVALLGGESSAPATLAITVVTPQPNSPPTASIVRPGQSAPGHGPPIHLMASVTSLDPILSYKWEVAHDDPNATWTVIGTTPEVDWKPVYPFVSNCSGQDVQFRVTVTNKNGSGSGVSTTQLMVPPC